MNYYAVGDIHGMLDAFRRILMDIDADKPNEPRKIILLGDYIDRGPNSKGVIDLIMRLQEDRGADNVIALMGNHEDMCLHDWRLWISNGGQETIASYNGAGEVSKEHRDWMRKLPRYYETTHNIFVHAGIDDQVPFIPMDQQSDSVLLWRRFHKGYNPNIGSRVLVHGHTPGHQVEMLPNRINLDTAAVFGGGLTAAKFGPESGQPIKFFNTLF